MRWTIWLAVWLCLIPSLALAEGEEESYPAYPPLSPYGASRFEEADRGVEIAWALAAIGPAAEPALLDALTSDNPEEQRCAAIGLGYLGPAAAPYVDQLVDEMMALDYPDYWLEVAVGHVGEAGIPRLIQELKLGGEQAYRACGALQSVGPEAQAAVPELIEVLQSAAPELQEAAADTLSYLGINAEPAIPALIAALEDPATNVRCRAAYALGELKLQPETVVPALSAALDKDDGACAYWYAEALGEYGLAASGAIPVVGRAFLELGRPNMLAGPLAALGTEAIPALIEALKSEDTQLRYYGGLGLGVVAQDAHGAVDALLAALDDTDTSVRWCAVQSLGFIGAQPDRVVPVLIDLVRDPDPTVRYCAVYALGFFGQKAAAAVDVLRQALHDEDELVQQGAVVSLGQIGPQASIAADEIRGLLPDGNGSLTSAATVALIQLGVPAVEVAQAAQAAMADEPLAWEMGSELYDLGPAAVPVLLELFHSAEGLRRIVAVATLGMLGSKAASANGELQAALGQDTDSLTEVAIALACVQTGSDPTLALPAIHQALVSPDLDARVYGAFAAEQLGSTAASLVPDLAPLLAEVDWSLQLSAVNALRAIGPPAEAAVDPLIAQLRVVAAEPVEDY